MPLQYLHCVPEMAGGTVDNNELDVFTSPILLCHHLCFGDSFYRDRKGQDEQTYEMDVRSF